MTVVLAPETREFTLRASVEQDGNILPDPTSIFIVQSQTKMRVFDDCMCFRCPFGPFGTGTNAYIIRNDALLMGNYSWADDKCVQSIKNVC